MYILITCDYFLEFSGSVLKKTLCCEAAECFVELGEQLGVLGSELELSCCVSAER